MPNLYAATPCFLQSFRFASIFKNHLTIYRRQLLQFWELVYLLCFPSFFSIFCFCLEFFSLRKSVTNLPTSQTLKHVALWTVLHGLEETCGPIRHAAGDRDWVEIMKNRLRNLCRASDSLRKSPRSEFQRRQPAAITSSPSSTVGAPPRTSIGLASFA